MMTAMTRRRVSLTPAHPSITMMQEAERELFARDRRSLLVATVDEGKLRVGGVARSQAVRGRSERSAAVRTLPAAGGAAATACTAFSAARDPLL